MEARQQETVVGNRGRSNQGKQPVAEREAAATSDRRSGGDQHKGEAAATRNRERQRRPA
eukprot:CAMPEP_0194318616 /NCGR_PEP_ID=MMETSP0171-20130528/15214_1 /TAXON_ID=218684 /ORGANISM="Corethron pennatum, Strain L29A3" /LENGTH=58 /DNA_ID=CAMNT_0039075589 /DNA_START=548 /DNA_END=721 /DNA_ORIENTATION=+